MNFCLVEEEINHNKYLLSMLISINLIYQKDYKILIACSEKTKEYILNFPCDYVGDINWLILENLDDNNIRYFKNILYAIDFSIDLFGEVTYIDTRCEMIKKMFIPDEIKNQGIGYVSRNVGYRESDIFQKYIFTILYVGNKNYLRSIDELLNKNILEWKDYSCDKYTFDELKLLNKKFVDYIIRLPYLLISELNIDKFFPHQTVVSTEDFFALHDRLKLSDIKKWKISRKIIENKKIECKNNEEEGNEDKKIECKDENNENSEENNPKEELIDEEVDISFVNIRVSNIEPQVIAVSKELYQRLAQFNIIHFLLVNLKKSNQGIEFIVPNKKGIGIWNRENDNPGLYELIEIICENNDYVGMKKINTDYFSFNDFLILDKPLYYYLNNSISKFTAVLLPKYNNTIISCLNQCNVTSLFLEYYSDFPKKLENIKNDDVKKTKFAIEIKENNKIVEWFLGKKKKERAQKTIHTLEKVENILDFIQQSKYLIIDEDNISNMHNFIIADCYALKCIPVYVKDPNELKVNLINFELNKNFLVEPKNWNDIDDKLLDEIVENNWNYYENNIKPDNYLLKLFKIYFEISLNQYLSNS